LEEILTGELPDNLQSLTLRASDLINSIGQTTHTDPSQGLSPEELATCVKRTLELPEIIELRPHLLPEFSVYGLYNQDRIDSVTFGIVDAIAFENDGRPQVVVDWKSDVSPSSSTLEHYGSQVRAYLKVTGAQRGLIVMLTTGQIININN
jgi:exodeoxyribonuclease-5